MKLEDNYFNKLRIGNNDAENEKNDEKIFEENQNSEENIEESEN